MTPSETCWGVLHMWAWFKSKIFISKSLKALEKSAVKKNGFFKLPLSKPNQKKVRFF
jgi:hypothetical protein